MRCEHQTHITLRVVLLRGTRHPGRLIPMLLIKLQPGMHHHARRIHMPLIQGELQLGMRIQELRTLTVVGKHQVGQLVGGAVPHLHGQRRLQLQARGAAPHRLGLMPQQVGDQNSLVLILQIGYVNGFGIPITSAHFAHREELQTHQRLPRHQLSPQHRLLIGVLQPQHHI